MKIESKSIWECFSTDLDIKVFGEFIGLIPGIVHDMSAIRDLSIDGHTNMWINVMDTAIGSSNKQLREH